MLLIPPLRRLFLPRRPADDSNYSQLHRYRDRVNAIDGAQLPGRHTQPVLRNGMMDMQPVSYIAGERSKIKSPGF